MSVDSDGGLVDSGDDLLDGGDDVQVLMTKGRR